MLGQLPVPIKDAVYKTQRIDEFYHNGVSDAMRGYRGMRLYIDKSTVYDNHQYRHVVVYESEKLKPEYRDYQVSLSREIKIDEYDVDIINEKLEQLGL